MSGIHKIEMALDEAIVEARSKSSEYQDLVFNGQEILDLVEMLEDLKALRKAREALNFLDSIGNKY